MHATADTGGCPAASHGWLRIKTGGCNGHIDAASRAGILYASGHSGDSADCARRLCYQLGISRLCAHAHHLYERRYANDFDGSGLSIRRKAIERIGDHATNLAEFTIYIVKGTDVRHISPEQLAQEALC